MTKRRRSAVLGAASVLMMAAGYGGFSDTETAAASIDSGTLVLGLDASGGASGNDCADMTRGATGEVPLGLTDAETTHGPDPYTVDRVLCIRNLGSGRGAVALQASGTSTEAGCSEDEAEAETGDDDLGCTEPGELHHRYRVTLLGGEVRDGECAAGDRRHLAGPGPIADFRAPELFTLEPGATACVVLRIEAGQGTPAMMTDRFHGTITTTLESR